MTGARFEEIPVDLCRPSPGARAVKAGEVLRLQASIAEVGLRQPINVRAVDGGYEVRGGGHRLAAFRALGRETIPAFVRDDDDLHAELAEIDENLCRNDLSPIERDLAVARRKALYEALHPETIKGATGKGRPKVRQNGEPKTPRFTADAADKTGLSERTLQRSVSRVETIGEEALNALVETTLNAPAELDALAALSPEKRESVVERAKRGEKVKATVELKKENRDTREADLANKQKALPQKRYGLIYVDVPRHFNVRSDETGMDRAPENHYPTMTFEQLCDLPVGDIAADDCILIYWSTAASLIDDLEIMAEWGFVTFRPRDAGRIRRDEWRGDRWSMPNVIPQPYRSMQVWDKVKIGLGYWFRDRHEFILIGARGNVVAPAQGTQDDSIFAAKKGEHSAKPAHVAEMIERLWPNTPKIELFARVAREGWDIWGKEAPIATAPMIADTPAPTRCHPETSLPDHDGPPSVVEPAPVSLAPSPAGAGSLPSDDIDLTLPDFLRRKTEGQEGRVM